MLHALALIPHPPLLLRELTGAADVGAALRDAVTAALRAVTAGAESVLAVGGDDTTRLVEPGERFDLGRFAPALRVDGPAAGPATRPLSLEVVDRGLRLAGWEGVTSMAAVGWQAGRAETDALAAAAAGDRRVSLVVAADGSARRGPKAPGHLDPDAVALDDRIDAALARSDPDPLFALGPDDGARRWIPGRAGLWVLAAGLAARAWPRPTTHYLGDPFGVRYRALTWTGDSAGRPLR